MRVIIDGYDLPGRGFCSPDGSPYGDVRVGVQIRKLPQELVPADADTAHWELDVDLVQGADGALDFRGPAVQGKRGERFLYLTWGNLDGLGHFDMFRRAKLMLNRIDPDVVRSADHPDRRLVARVRLSDDLGAPRCARVDPPAISWQCDDL